MITVINNRYAVVFVTSTLSKFAVEAIKDASCGQLVETCVNCLGDLHFGSKCQDLAYLKCDTLENAEQWSLELNEVIHRTILKGM